MPQIARFAIAAVLYLAAAPAWADSDLPRITPHKAVYSIGLLESEMGEVGQVDGAMAIELAKSCDDGWTVSTELRMATGSGDTPAMRLEIVTVDTESLDGRRFTFDSEVRVNGETTERIVGEAALNEDGAGSVTFESPIEGTKPLPNGTLFPINAFRNSLDAVWVRDEKLINYLYFDGSMPEPLRATDIVAGVAEPLPEGLKDPDGLTAGLTSQDARRIVTTVFDMSRTDAEPQTTYIGDGLPNGILTRLTIDLGFMVTEARLVELSALNDPDCG